MVNIYSFFVAAAVLFCSTEGSSHRNKLIATGDISKVYLANDHTTAIKVLNDGRLYAKMQFENERSFIGHPALSHPHIISYLASTPHDYDYDDDDDHVIKSKYIKGQNVNKHFRVHSKEGTMRYVTQLLLAIHHLHLNGITHNDLSPENILIDENADCIKIVDFGKATIHRDFDSPDYLEAIKADYSDVCTVLTFLPQDPLDIDLRDLRVFLAQAKPTLLLPDQVLANLTKFAAFKK